MSLSLVIHRPEGAPSHVVEAGAGGLAAMRAALRDAVWEVADAHWALGEEAILVSTDLSPDYLVSHFRRALARRGFSQPGQLLVAAIGTKTAWAGLPADAEAWLREVLP